MVNHEILEKTLNEEGKKILSLIKNDYYSFMSDKKRKVLDDLLDSDKFVIINNGFSDLGRKVFAHGGRAKRDGKIHFYPDSREFNSDEEIIEKCLRLLPHEIFHFFIQPDNLRFETGSEKEMANFYTEGLVERETRRFCEKHKEIKTEKALYGNNIGFVNSVEAFLGSSNYEVIFSESDYIRKIKDYTEIYTKYKNRKAQREVLDINSKDEEMER